MFRKIYLLLGIFFMLGSVVMAEDLRINGKEVQQGQSINLFFDDLEAGKIKFSVSEDKLKKAEVTFDKGRNWIEMSAEDNTFNYGYRPLSDEIVIPEFILTSESGSIRTIRPNISVRYQRKKPDQAVDQLFEKMKTFYENEDINNFINLFSMSYPDRVKFREAIQNDFYNYKNMRLFYRVDQRIFDDDFQGAVCSVYWERKGDSRTGTGFSDSAIMSMRLDKEGNNWLISGLRNNTIFGSSLIGTTSSSTSQPDLTISSSDITVVKSLAATYSVLVTAKVSNIGSASVNNVRIKFYKKSPLDADYVDISDDQTIATISAGSYDTASITYRALAVLGGNHTFKIVIDPNNNIIESNKSNNSAISAVHDITP